MPNIFPSVKQKARSPAHTVSRALADRIGIEFATSNSTSTLSLAVSAAIPGHLPGKQLLSGRRLTHEKASRSDYAEQLLHCRGHRAGPANPGTRPPTNPVRDGEDPPILVARGAPLAAAIGPSIAMGSFVGRTLTRASSSPVSCRQFAKSVAAEAAGDRREIRSVESSERPHHGRGSGAQPVAN